MTEWRKVLDIVLSSLIGATVAIAVPFFLLSAWLGPPSDKAMIRDFQTHRAQFEELQGTLQQDSGIRFIGQGVDWQQDANSPTVPYERVARYHSFMKELRLTGITRGDGGLEFDRAGEGAFLTGWTKAYVYTETPPPVLLDDTGGVSTDEPVNEAWHHIEGNWYVYYLVEP